uniref:Adenomatous polyposis coli protein n=1 Tax=Clastoptera arizonana TaxID=38151 RepID=A0A1B6D309_9HEMI
MTLPVSSYEELLTRVRSLTQETRQLQRQLDSPLLDHNDNERLMNGGWNSIGSLWRSDRTTMPAAESTEPPQLPDPKVLDSPCNGSNAVLARLLGWPSKEEVSAPEAKEQDERRTSPETSVSTSPGENHKWNPTEYNLWHSVGPITDKQTNSEESTLGPRSYSQQQLGAKVEMVYSLLSMLGTHDRDEMTRTLLAMSSSPESCIAMRQSGCLPLLVQLVHGGQESPTVRRRAAQALHNLVHCHTDDKRGRREARVLRLVEQIQEYCNILSQQRCDQITEDPHPGAAIAALMKLSFDEEHRHAMCQLGALYAIANLIQADTEIHGSEVNTTSCVTLRRYAGMALTNLTFGDGNNKALLCSMRAFMSALVAQLRSPSEDLRQVTASVLRNLSWRADNQSKTMLRQVNAVVALMIAAMDVKKESTLKSILSALWNLSAHCNMNKVDICGVDGALQYLVETLTFPSPSKSLAIVENAGGILRNISSHIAVREDYRATLREHNCLPILLQQLKSPSLTIVSNACGTLWNLSARCHQDQRTLWELGAVPMLRSLVHSKHKMISMGSSAALKNLLAARPEADIMDRVSRGLPTLLVRKRRALEQELDATLSETCDNIEPPERWDSRESVTSTHSENIFDRNARIKGLNTGSLQSIRRLDVETNPPNNPQPEELSDKMQRLNIDNRVTSSDQPIDFNLKYNDCTSSPISDKNKLSIECNHSYIPEKKAEIESSQPIVVYENADYAETDLDQPTDYSLKYQDNEHTRDIKTKNIVETPDFVENLDLVDQPTNYSLKYRESGGLVEDGKEVVVMSSHYAETDLDQPTDYSLRYAEDDSEKPQTYCTEGTPYNFSTATSLSDLRTPDANKSGEATKLSGGLSPAGSITSLTIATQEGSDVVINPVIPATPKEETREGKVVTFETPLMFSRCSSLGSISSCEPPDDRSSVVSEFSRMTSGMVSPSELPDSPTETIPHSPRNVKPPVPIPQVMKTANVSVFEERVSVFKEESTPVQFSTATSLSSLTFDDEINAPEQVLPKVEDKHHTDVGTAELAPVSEEEDEDMLAACINIGMQNSTSNRQRNTTAPLIGKTTPIMRCPPTQRKNSGIPVKTPPKRHSHLSESEVLGDSTTEFCTEDTPANVSHATSHSDLSMLCTLSDDGSSDHDNILAECIQSGMPQARMQQNNAIRLKPKATVLPTPGVRVSMLPARQISSSVPVATVGASPRHSASMSPPIRSHKDIRSEQSELPSSVQTNVKSDRCCLISPAGDDGASPLSSLEPEEEAITILSRQPSVGSLSGDWTEEQVSLSEQVLLEQCITSGMPKTKNGINPSAGHIPADEEGEMKRTAVTTEINIRKQPTDVMKESGDTWNEESPNDVSFPSISLVAPMITSYKSLSEDNMKLESASLLDDISLTDSRIIELEAGKVAIISHMEMESSYHSLDLESVRPPSAMGSLLSLTASVSEADKRKDRMRGLLARRAIGDSSLSWNNLDSVKPPSAMDEVLELENSILSCASLTSEIADSLTISPPNSVSEDITLADTSETLEALSPVHCKLTPKMKRQMVKERYNTYTITGDDSRESSLEPDIHLECDIVEENIGQEAKMSKLKRLTPKQKRIVDKDRFRTRTLGDEEIPVPSSPKEKRIMDKERFKTQTLNAAALIVPNEEKVPEVIARMETEQIDEMSDDFDDDNDEGKACPIVVKPSEVKSVRGRRKVKSHIPIVSRSTPVTNSKIQKPLKTPPPLQRQGTFTKEEPVTPSSGIPVFSKKPTPLKSVPGNKKTTPTSTTATKKNNYECWTWSSWKSS